MVKGKTRLLIVEDEIVTLMVFKKFFSTNEIAVDTAETLEEALDCINRKNYAVILADLRLTGVTGEEGLEILKAVRKKKLETQVIIITGYGTPETKKEAFALGASHFFEKPVSPYTLLAAMDIGSNGVSNE